MPRRSEEALREYKQKRRSGRTPEPGLEESTSEAVAGGSPAEARFVVQLHSATRQHYDLRLEVNGVLKSWAVPKGPSMVPSEARLAIRTEDHPMEYASFEGRIPKGNYGAGLVSIWDQGTYTPLIPMVEGLEKGDVKIVLHGQRLRGAFALVRTRKQGRQEPWLLIKKREVSSVRPSGGRSSRGVQQMIPRRGSFVPLWDGYSCRVVLKPNGKVELRSLRGQDLSRKFVEICDALRRLAAGLAVGSRSTSRPPTATLEIEGTLVPTAGDGLGTPRKRGNKGGAYVFHMLTLPDIAPVTQRRSSWAVRARKVERLLERVGGVAPWVRVSPWAATWDRALALGPAEAIVGVCVFDPDGRRGETLKVARRDLDAMGALAALSPVPETRVRVTHATKIYFPQENLTKGDIVEYYRAIAPWLLPHVKGRPQSLHRFPNGIESKGFFQKDVTGLLPSWMGRIVVQSRGRGRAITYALCDDLDSLLFLANLGCIELNVWNARVPDLECPDYLVVDLDPDRTPWSAVLDVALGVRDEVVRRGGVPFIKTSGGRGLHVYVPIEPRHSHREVRDVAEVICREVHKSFEKTTSLERSPVRRKGKIYLDYLQNGRSQTMVAAFSVRPRSGAHVSMPVPWHRIEQGVKPEEFTVQAVRRQIQDGSMHDPWDDFAHHAVRLEQL